MRTARLATGPRVPSPLVELRDERLSRHGVRLWLKRDDLIHPELPGNKWRKLKYNLAAAADQGHDTLLTFGGAYSNHIRATAAAGDHVGFKTVGVIRGEEHLPLNPSLAYAVGRGMRLTYLDRDSYRRKRSAAVIERLAREFGSFYLLPEGGSNELAVRGCAELPAEIAEPFDVIATAVGTGGTLAGVAAGLQPAQEAVGFAALKGAEFLADDVSNLQQRTYGHVTGNWHIELGFHCGGYAKRSAGLDSFIDEFEARQGVRLDWTFVGKMMLGLFTMIQAGQFAPGTRLVAVVTGAG